MGKENVWDYAYQKGIVRVTEHAEALPFLKFRRNYKVLDMGCGKGILLRNLVKRFSLEGYAIDIVYIKEHDLVFVKADAQNLPFRDGAFDVVYSLGVVEHLPSTEKAIFESFRVLKEKGQVLHTVPNNASAFRFIDMPFKHFLGCWELGLAKCFSLRNFQDMMINAGFRNVRHKLISWDFKKGSTLSKIYGEFDNLMSRVFVYWGFFIAMYGLKNKGQRL